MVDSVSGPNAPAFSSLAKPEATSLEVKISLAPTVSVERIGSERDLAAFFAAGGRVLVVPASELGVATRLVPVEVHARLRDGARTLLVVTPLGSADGSAPWVGYAPAAMRGAEH